MEFLLKEVPYLEVRVDADMSLVNQIKYVGAEFRKWVVGLPKGFKASLARIRHHGDYVTFRYEAMDSRV
jgi:hypothetical protein